MKRILTLFIFSIVALTAAAQGAIKQSIIIDPTTFRPVQTDPLTGVNIDPIGLDLSRRPCARIKIFFHQMTREQMEQLVAVYPSGSIQGTKCKVAEGNTVLILEMTAKPATKFYLTHPKFGTSNEVEFNLEGNKEYQLEATLNKQLTINIASNVTGASVYINDEFRGTTVAPNNICTIADLFQGTYNLRLEYGDRKSESKIEVIDGSNIYFRLDIDETAPVYQYLVLNTTPKSALVEIDGKSVQRKSGKIEVRLTKGVHMYRISADNYYTLSDTVMIDGSRRRIKDVALKPQFGYLKVDHNNEFNGAEVYVNNRMRGTLPLDKPISIKSGEAEIRIVKSLYHDFNTTVNIYDDQTTTINAELKPNFAEVTIVTEDNSEIWIDDQKYGTGKWKGRLEIGNYTVICKKESHEEHHSLLNVPTTESITQNYGALKPIYGSLDISCNIDGAKFYIDGVEKGTLPYIDNAVLIGNRQVKITAPGYRDYNESVIVEKGKTATVSAELKKGSTYYSSSSYNSHSSTQSNGASKSTSYGYKDRSHMLQFGIGIEYAFGSKTSAICMPLEFRIGRIDQLVNGFIGANFVYRANKFSSKTSDDGVDVGSLMLSPVAKLRFNTKRSDDFAVFYDIGGIYNLVRNTTYNEIDIESKPNFSALFSVGCGFSLMDLYVYGTYDITNAYRGIESPDVDIDMEHPFLKNRFTLGLGLKIYLGSGFMKR